MTIQISSYAFVFLCPNNSLSRTWRSSSAGFSPGEPKTWPTPPVPRSPINLSWFACVFKTHYFRSNRFYLFFSQWSFFGRNCVLHSTLLLISFVFFFLYFHGFDLFVVWPHAFWQNWNVMTYNDQNNGEHFSVPWCFDLWSDQAHKSCQGIDKYHQCIALR